MKEWTIRIGCVLLGAALALGTTKLNDMIKGKENEPKEDAQIVIEPVAKNPVTEPEPTQEAEQEAAQDYELEAELKFQKLMDELISDEDIEQIKEEESNYPPNSIEAAPVRWIKDYPRINSDCLLEEKEAQRSSYDETMAVNAFDKMVIENSTIDFSDVKITVMGDSISAGNTLPEEEQGIYDWPSQLKEILGAKELVNLSIGGSIVSSCKDHYPMCQRWSEIPYDSDIIIVMGGSNDMLFEDKWQFGNIEYEHRMTKNTFCGDLDDMCSRMQWVYRDHNEDNYCKLLYINPPSTVLNDGWYAVDPGNLVQQKSFAEAINTIVPAYSFEVIDLYNNNILNSHDKDINEQFVPDGIHCNKEGYRILAEHVASQIIQRIEQ